MNSKCGFEFFFGIIKADFLYKCKYDPQYLFEQELFDADPEDPDDFDRIPENIIETESFRERAQEMYLQLVHNHLLDKQWFKKVDALECFSDFYEFGRGIKFAPTHNSYIPGPTVMKRPKFKDYERENFSGGDFAYRSDDTHTPSPLVLP